MLTWFQDADFSDAEFFGVRVDTLNDDVTVFVSGRCACARDSDHQANSHSDTDRPTDRVRVSVDCYTDDWRGAWKPDLEVV